jgi:hypothetical protein
VSIPKSLPVAIVFAGLLLCACVPAGPGRTSPTSEEARAVLSSLVATAQRGDFESLCRTADGEPNPTCLSILEEAGRDVPRASPTVVAERTVDAGATTAAGRVLTVCGLDNKGRAYRSELLFFYTSGRIDVVQPVWWSGFSVEQGTGGAVGSASTDNSSPAPGCG